MNHKPAWELVLELEPGSARETAPPMARALPSEAVRDRFVGAMVGGAAGDALGRHVERWERAEVRATYPGGLRDYMPWRGWVSGPVGTITDDTQLSLAVAGWLRDAAGAALPDGTDFGRRVAEWGPVARGAGIGSSTASSRLAAGVPWWESGNPTYGNGVAMRSAAIGLRYQGDGERIREAVAISGLATHRHQSALAGGLVIAALTSHLVALDGREPAAAELVAAAVAPLEGLNLPLHPVGGYPDREATLTELISSVPDLLDWDLDRAFDHFYNGSAVFQSLPIALWLLCKFGAGDAEELLVHCVSGGRDADTIAAMVGNLVGALHGLAAFPARWTGDELEYRDELVHLSNDLFDLWATDVRNAGGAR